MGEEIVEEQLSRHELGGIDEYDDEGRMSVEKVVKLFFGSQVFH
mgnify:CR=1 FL=1